MVAQVLPWTAAYMVKQGISVGQMCELENVEKTFY